MSGQRTLAAAVIAALCLVGCSERPAEPARKADVDAAADKALDAAAQAGRKAADLAEKARDNTVEYLRSPQVQQRAADAKEAVKDALDGPEPKPAPPRQDQEKR